MEEVGTQSHQDLAYVPHNTERSALGRDADPRGLIALDENC
jgi:hypothetical protein